MMRTLALDVGEVRIGCAISDPDNKIASPLSVISYKSIQQAQREIKEIVEEYEVGEVVVGLPLSLDGEEGPHARHTRSLSTKLLENILLPVHYFDERLSSAQAKDVLFESGLDAKKSRGKVDMIAASVFLQAYLDQKGQESV